MTRIALVAALLVAAISGCGREGEPLEAPTPLVAVSPFEFPLELWDRGLEGETVLLIHVTAGGEVDSAVVHTSSGHNAFDSAAVVGARKLRFSPARRGGKRVETWARLPVRFMRDSAAVEATMPEAR